MLDLHRVDLGELAVALEDHSYDHSWWLDPETGEVVLWGDYFAEQDEPDPESRELRPIEAIPSHEGYEEMQAFIERVRDPRARDLLERAVAGRGAFRRFKDTLLDFPDLRDSWFRFHHAQLERRAIRWLLDEGLIDEASAASALAERPEPELPLLSSTFDPHEIAREVARDLRRMYGDRLRTVLLFGSWARGDAHPESDIDLLVVLDRVESVWDELRQMDPILWKHSFANDTVVMAVPVSSDAFEERRRPVVARPGRGVAGRLTALGRSREEIAAARLLAGASFWFSGDLARVLRRVLRGRGGALVSRREPIEAVGRDLCLRQARRPRRRYRGGVRSNPSRALRAAQ